MSGNGDNESMEKLQHLTTLMNTDEREYNEVYKKLEAKKKDILRQEQKLEAENRHHVYNTKRFKQLKDEVEQLHLTVSTQLHTVNEMKSASGCDANSDQKMAVPAALILGFRNVGILSEHHHASQEEVLASLKAQLATGAYATELPRLKAAIIEGNSALARYQSGLDVVQRRCAELTSERLEAEQRVGALTTERRCLASKVSAEEEKAAGRPVEDSVDALTVQLTSAEQTLAGYEGDVTASAEDLVAKDTELHRLREATQMMRTRIEALEDEETTMMLAIDATKSALAATEARCRALQDVQAAAAAAHDAEAARNAQTAAESSQIAATAHELARSRSQVQETTASFLSQLSRLQGPTTASCGGSSGSTNTPARDRSQDDNPRAELVQCEDKLRVVQEAITKALADADAARVQTTKHHASIADYSNSAASLRDKVQALQNQLDTLVHEANAAPVSNASSSSRDGGSVGNGSDDCAAAPGTDLHRLLVEGKDVYSVLHFAQPAASPSASSSAAATDGGTVVATVAAIDGAVHALLASEAPLAALKHTVASSEAALASLQRRVNSKEQALCKSLQQKAVQARVKQEKAAHAQALAVLDAEITVADAQFRADFVQLDADFAAAEDSMHSEYRSKLKQLQSLKMKSILSK
jgi:predicted  nucleic acid-binding Zn-ribbon protein